MKNKLLLLYFFPLLTLLAGENVPYLLTGGKVMIEQTKNESSVSVHSHEKQYFFPRFALIPEKNKITLPPAGAALYEVRVDFKNHNSGAGSPSDWGWGEFGGVMGWLDKKSKIGIGLSILGIGKQQGEIVIAQYDLNKGFSDGISTTSLRSVSGEEFSPVFTPIDRNIFTTCILRFHKVSSKDLAAWDEATTRVEAIVQQGDKVLGSVTFLSNLPIPDEHYAGEFGGSKHVDPSVEQIIGFYKNFNITIPKTQLP